MQASRRLGIPSIRQRWTFPAVTPSLKLVLDLSTHVRMKGCVGPSIFEWNMLLLLLKCRCVIAINQYCKTSAVTGVGGAGADPEICFGATSSHRLSSREFSSCGRWLFEWRCMGVTPTEMFQIMHCCSWVLSWRSQGAGTGALFTAVMICCSYDRYSSR